MGDGDDEEEEEEEVTTPFASTVGGADRPRESGRAAVPSRAHPRPRPPLMSARPGVSPSGARGTWRARGAHHYASMSD